MGKTFEMNNQQISTIAQIYQRTEKSINTDVENLKNWMKTQPHLPEILDEKTIQNFLILNKFSIERAKQSIDMYYTIRTRFPEIYQDSNPKLKTFQENMDVFNYVMLPKLTKEMYRVTWMKIHDKQRAENVDPYKMVKIALNIQEVRLKEDVMFGDICVFDAEDVPMSYFFKMTPTFFAKVFLIYEKIFSIPLKGLYYLNAPPVINTVLGIMKTMLKPKIFDRIHVCKDTSILHQAFPKEMIPKDYGGEEKSVKELSDLLKVKFEQYAALFDHLDTVKVDETLRPEKLRNDEILGFHGNFKKLDVD